MAAELGNRDLHEGFKAIGTRLGTPEYTTEVLDTCVCEVESLEETFVRMPLSVHDQFLLLRVSLSVRRTHLMRTVPYAALEPNMHSAKVALWRGGVAILS